MKCSLRENEKIQLLKKIQQQRQELAKSSSDWLEITAPYDHIWQKLISLRHYLVTGASLLTLYGIRHPSKLVTWSKRLLGTWATVKWVRRTLLSGSSSR